MSDGMIRGFALAMFGFVGVALVCLFGSIVAGIFDRSPSAVFPWFVGCGLGMCGALTTALAGVATFVLLGR